MSLQTLIKQRIALIGLSTVCEQLGYLSIEKASKRITEIVNSPVLCLDQAGFDFHYSTPDLIRKLCELLEIPALLCNQVIDDINARLALARNKFASHLFIETNFKRKNEPVFALAAMESQRYISIDPVVQDLPLNEQLDHIQKLAISHYSTQSSLELWGEIQQYAYFYDAETIIIFSPAGEVINAVNEYPVSRARLSI